MRADRLLSIMLLLQVQRRVTARELAQRLEVSERTIHRDMEALSAAGIPVTAERGAHGGWMLLEEYRTNLTGLNDAEIRALFLTQPPRLLADLGLDKASEAAWIKLLAALPSVKRRGAEYVRQRIYVDAGGWGRYEESFPFLSVLQEAVWEERQLRLNYQRGDGESVERLVDPLGLVAKSNIWYLVAGVEGEIRTYRVSRVTNAQLTDTPCMRPEGFDLMSHWRQSTTEFVKNLPRYPATVRATSEILPKLKSLRFARIEREYPPDEDGWIMLDMNFEVIEEATENVLSLGPKIEVIAPDELRQRVLDSARDILAVYSENMVVAH